MRFTITITDDTIKKVKKLLLSNSIRESARVAEVSYYTAWCISKGKYDNAEPLQLFAWGNRCPITGFLIDSNGHHKH